MGRILARGPVGSALAENLRQAGQPLPPERPHLLHGIRIGKPLVRDGHRGLAPALRVERREDPGAAVPEVESGGPALLGGPDPQRPGLEPPAAPTGFGERGVEPVRVHTDGLAHADGEPRGVLVLGPHPAGSLVAERDCLRPPAGHAMLLAKVCGDLPVRSLPRTPSVEDAEPVPPALPGVLSDGRVSAGSGVRRGERRSPGSYRTGTTSASTATHPFGPAISGFTSMASIRSPRSTPKKDRRTRARATASRSAAGRPLAPSSRGRIESRSISARARDSSIGGSARRRARGTSISTPPAATSTSGPNCGSRTTPRASSTPGCAISATETRGPRRPARSR